jgi:hypothetical protein
MNNLDKYFCEEDSQYLITPPEYKYFATTQDEVEIIED